MGRRRVILINILTAAVVLVFVVLYAVNAYNTTASTQIAAFNEATASFERVMNSFMLGEQRICNNWAHYVTSQHMTMDEAIDYVRAVKPSEGTAHIVYVDDNTYSGLSTATPAENPNLNSVSYAHTDVLKTLEHAEPGDDTVNLSDAYTNPIDGKSSVAFCHAVTLRDAAGGRDRQAVLMRVIPVAALDAEWSFLSQQHEGAQAALMDASGDYVMRDAGVEDENFFAFARANGVPEDQLDVLRQQFVQGEAGHVVVPTSANGDVLFCFVPSGTEDSRLVVSRIPMEKLVQSKFGASLVATVAVGLLLIVTVNFAMQFSYRKRLGSAEQTASKAQDTKNGFLMAMSRDFRVPLNTLMGVTAVAKSKLGDTEVVGDCLRKIGLHGDYLSTMLNDILDMYQLEDGELVLNPAPFSIVDSSTTLVNMTQAMLREKNIQFSFHVDQLECESFYADQVRINQILINLLSSALKLCDQGGTVHVSLGERLGQTPATATLVYTVTTSGVQSTPEELQALDDPFAPNVSELPEDVQSAALGIAVAQKIAQLVGGRIEFRAAPGQGTTCIATLELRRAQEASLQDIALPSVRVLVVDQNADLRLTAKETLQSLGAVVGTAASGEEALAMLREEQAEAAGYDVVILGRRMPGLDGLHTARLIHDELPQPLPKILISAYDWTDLRERARRSGVDGFISKPLFRSTLYNKISKVLGLEVATTPEEANADLAGMHLLVVEDNDINWTLVSALLEPYGITCERAENGQQAVDRMAAARDGEISLVIMDVRMPVMDGLEATRAIRALPTTNAGVPIVAMSAETRASDVAACTDAGMNGHIAKPVDIAHLLQEVGRARAGKREAGVEGMGE